MKIALFEVPLSKRKSFDILKQYPILEMEFIEEPLTEKNIDDYLDTEILSVFIHSKLDEKVLGKLAKLKFIAARSTGFDHIDSKFCKKQAIVISNVPNYGGDTVAEYVFGLILTISRKIYDTLSRTRNGNFSREGLNGFDLKDKTIGIVGFGSIGRNTARIANGFGMRVIAYDIIEDPNLNKSIEFEYKSLEDVLKESDIISLNVPATFSTGKMIGQKEFSIMKEGVILINTARGSVIDTKFLIIALNQGKVAAVGLDVLFKEELFYKELQNPSSEIDKPEAVLENLILLKMPNVYITPHNAFNTKEALERIIEITNSNIISFLKGEPKNIVNLNLNNNHNGK